MVATLAVATCAGLAGCVGGGGDTADGGGDGQAPTVAPATPSPAGPADQAPRPPELVADPRPCPAGERFKCFTLRVDLDRDQRAKGATGRLTLRVAVQPGARPPKGYLVYLTGGPGQPGLPFAQGVAERLGEIAPGYGLVLLDQRGTGENALDCPQLQRSVGSSDIAVAARGSVEACARQVGAKRAAFTTADTVTDLEDLRRALGAERLTLAGVSYGSFVAERYALTHPDRVRALILDSVVVQDGADALLERTMAAVPRVLRAICERDRCPGDVAADLRAALAFGADDVALLDTLATLSIGEPRLDDVPPALRAAARGRLEELERLNDGVREDAANIPPELFSAGLHAATLCAEIDVPWTDATALPADREQGLAQARGKLTPGRLGGFEPATAVENGLADTCRRWPPLPEAPRAPTGSLPPVPTLLLAGELDLVTPLEDAREQLRRAPRGTLVVVPDMGHSLLSQDTSGCALRAAERLLAGRPVPSCRR